MQDKKIFFAQEFYEQHLSTINTVYFTNREIDENHTRMAWILFHLGNTYKERIRAKIQKEEE